MSCPGGELHSCLCGAFRNTLISKDWTEHAVHRIELLWNKQSHKFIQLVAHSEFKIKIQDLGTSKKLLLSFGGGEEVVIKKTKAKLFS